MHDVSPQTLHNVTALIVNYKTRDLTAQCVESFLSAYPEVRLLLVDNGSSDDSTDYIRTVTERYPHVSGIFNQQNIYHGPAMHQGIMLSTTRYILTIDSDVIVQQTGFIEGMLALFDDPATYAVGHVQCMDRFGFALPPDARCYTSYVHPALMLFNRDIYTTLPPFFHHGSPCLRNMRAAQRRAYRLCDFPVAEFCVHLGQGTCSRYGYGLSVKTFIESYVSRLCQWV